MKLSLGLILLLLSQLGYASVKSYFNLREGVSYVDPYTGLEREGDNLEQVILDEIKTAKKTIFVAVQELRLPLLAKALVEKHKAGVDVRIVLEQKYNHNVLSYKEELPSEDDLEGAAATQYRHLIALIDVNDDGRITRQEMLDRDAIFILNQGKVPMIDDTEDGTTGSSLMHHKFIVIDGQRVVLGSANFTPNCIHGDYRSEGSRGNANALMTVKSTPLARLFTEEFEILWSAKFGKDKPFRGARTVNVGGKKITVQFSPTPSKVDWSLSTNGLIARTMGTAKKSVNAALFVFADQRLSDQLQVLYKKDVEISMLVEKRFAYRFFSDVLDILGVELPNYRCVVAPGNNPWSPGSSRVGHTKLSPLDFLHHKYGVVDRSRVIFGSHNWSNSANLNNDEYLVVVEDTETAAGFEAEYERLAQNAEWGIPLSLEENLRRTQQRCAQR